MSGVCFYLCLMRLLLRKPAQALARQHIQEPVYKTQLVAFEQSLTRLLSRVNEQESADFQRSIVTRFLAETHYGESFRSQNAPEALLQLSAQPFDDEQASLALIVVKRVYGAEMMMPLKPNVRALHELILAYFEKRAAHPDQPIHHLIATDVYNWFLFDEVRFREVFYENAKLRRLYQIKQQLQKDSQYFYSEAAKVIRDLKTELPVTYVNLRELGHSPTNHTADSLRRLLPVYKLFAPAHLLKQDSIIASQYGDAFYEQIHSICTSPTESPSGVATRQRVVYLLRALLVAFMEAQEGHYGQPLVEIGGNVFADYIDALTDQLGIKPIDSTDTAAKEFDAVLNSFVIVPSVATVILDDERPFLTPNVIGVFLKRLNDYEQETFPSGSSVSQNNHVTAELRWVIVQRFNEQFNWRCESFDALKNQIDTLSLQTANEVINTLHIADLAVGSGHFLTIAINELIAVKAELGILCDADGCPLRQYTITVEDGALLVADAEGVLFDYQLATVSDRPTEKDRVQKTLFNEKQTFVNNCLVGVDNNPMAACLGRFRLLLELLTTAYVGAKPDLTKLRIVIGNSLVNRTDTEGKSIVERLQRLQAEYRLKYHTNQLFPLELSLQQQKDKEKREQDMARLEARLREQQNELVYGQAINWPDALPELTDKEGGFTGFDLIIGELPVQEPEVWAQFGPYLKQTFPEVYSPKAPPFIYFVVQGSRLLKPMGLACWTLPIDWAKRSYANKFRRWLESYRTTPVGTFAENSIIVRSLPQNK